MNAGSNGRVIEDRTARDAIRSIVVTLGLSHDATDWLNDRLPGVVVCPAAGVRDLLKLVAARAGVSVVIVYHTLDGPPGFDALMRLRQSFPQLPVVYILDRRLDSETGRALLRQAGIEEPLLAPVDRMAFLSRLERLLEDECGGATNGRGSVPVLGGEDLVSSDEQPAGSTGGAHESIVAERLDLRDRHDLRISNGPTVGAAEETVTGGTDRHLLLLIDDAADVSEQIVTEGAARGMRVITASSLLEGRLMLTRERPDALLLDLGIANNSDEGLALLEELDRHSLTVPVLFLAERDSLIDRVQAVSLGGRAFLPKTMPPADILKAVDRILQQLQASESRVLAVDSDPRVLADLRALLEPKGIKLTTLDDPLHFWGTLELTVPDLLMVDVDLPRWSGLELCKVVRNDTRWSGLSVLCLTANADSDTVQGVFDAGADDFVSKPIVGPELVTKVVNRLQRIQLYRIMAEIDPLTGVANRLRATEGLDRLLRLAKRQPQVFSLALLDLDNFKQINDRFGHGTGDEALRRLGSLLARTFRAEDVVARFGGDEFIVGMYGMPQIGGVHKLTTLLETLQEQTPPRMRSDGVLLTLSAGVAEFPNDGQDLDELREAADAALYRAKKSGKNIVFAAGGAT